jgi:hypothetical protein
MPHPSRDYWLRLGRSVACSGKDPLHVRGIDTLEGDRDLLCCHTNRHAFGIVWSPSNLPRSMTGGAPRTAGPGHRHGVTTRRLDPADPVVVDWTLEKSVVSHVPSELLEGWSRGLCCGCELVGQGPPDGPRGCGGVFGAHDG